MKVYECPGNISKAETEDDIDRLPDVDGEDDYDADIRHVRIITASGTPVAVRGQPRKSPQRRVIRQKHQETIPEDQIHLTPENEHLNHPPPNSYRRTSLHGKPLYLRYSRNDAKYRRLQSRIYNFLERPKTPKAITYHVLVFACVLSCLIFNVLATMETKPDNWASDALFYLELFMLFWFFTEYCLRIWSAGCRSRYQTLKGRLLFAKRPFCLVDITVILTSVVVLALGPENQKIAASPVRGLRFFQILRMIRMDRKGGSWKLLFAVVWAHRQELFTTMYIGFLGLISCSFVMYLVEKEQNEKINSYADALWWGVITLCTVGYGDTVPKTWIGKFLASFCAVLGISFFALPAGILGSGFALKVQQNQRQKHLIRRRVPAATLIQCLWRCYAADPNSTSVATWKTHLKNVKNPTGFPPSGSKSFERMSQKFGRFGTMKRRQALSSAPTPPANGTHMPVGKTASYPRSLISTQNTDGQDSDQDFSMRPKSRISQIGISMSEIQSRDELKVQDEGELNLGVLVKSLSPMDKTLIRIIRKIRFFVARRKFKEALRPYDVKDVIEQYSAGHLDMLSRVKALQLRLDQILGTNRDKDLYDSNISLGSRIYSMENKISDIDCKIDLLMDLVRSQDQRPLSTPIQKKLQNCLDFKNKQSQKQAKVLQKADGMLQDESFEFGSEEVIETSLSLTPSEPISLSNNSLGISGPSLIHVPRPKLKPEDDPLLMSEEVKGLKKSYC